jgi:hypothetical protein
VNTVEQIVAQLRADGFSGEQIGRLVGVSRQAVHKRWGSEPWWTQTPEAKPRRRHRAPFKGSCVREHPWSDATVLYEPSGARRCRVCLLAGHQDGGATPRSRAAGKGGSPSVPPSGFSLAPLE